MNYLSEHRNGLIGTVLIHGVILILMLLFGFLTPLPLPGEEGILVNFGNSDQGFGIEEPAAGGALQVAAVQEEKVQSPPPAPAPAAAAPKKAPAKEEIMTQNYEKTVAIESANAEARKRQEELDRQRKLAEEKKLQEQREQERQAELARQKKEAEQQKINQINSLAANAFGSPGGGAGTSSSTGQGVTYPGGNQGSPDGSPTSSNYGVGGSGSGSSGSGPSFSLAGRNALSLPKPAYTENESGTVVVSVTVDKYGKVTNAVPGVQGTNTSNTTLIQAAREAALKARFNADPTAAAFQKGTITYRFVLD